MKGILTTNAGFPELTPAQIQEGKAVESTQVLYDAAEKAAKGAAAGGSTVAEDGAKIIASKDLLADKRAFAAGTRPRTQPQYLTENGRVTGKVWTKAEWDAVLNNVYCPRCDSLQAVFLPVSFTRHEHTNMCTPPERLAPPCGWPIGEYGLDAMVMLQKISLRVLHDNEKDVF